MKQGASDVVRPACVLFQKNLETASVIASCDIRRRLVICTAIVVVDNFTNRIIIHAKDAVGKIFIVL